MRRDPHRRGWPRRRAVRLRGRGRRQLRACAGGPWLRDLMSDAGGRRSGDARRIVRASRSSGSTRRSTSGARDRRSTAFAPPGSIAPSALANGSRSTTAPADGRAYSRGSTQAGRLLMRSEQGLETIEAADLWLSASLGRRGCAGGLVGFPPAGRPSLDDGRQRARVRPARRLGRDRHELRPLRLWTSERAPMADGRPRRRLRRRGHARRRSHHARSRLHREGEEESGRRRHHPCARGPYRRPRRALAGPRRARLYDALRGRTCRGAPARRARRARDPA